LEELGKSNNSTLKKKKAEKDIQRIEYLRFGYSEDGFCKFYYDMPPPACEKPTRTDRMTYIDIQTQCKSVDSVLQCKTERRAAPSFQ
jgi:hypothetical protein